MPIFIDQMPLSLYIHLPWCVRKCPYCDFNSHEAKAAIPEEAYVNALMRDLDHYADLIHDRTLQSIFFGGGTPSLFSASAIDAILSGIAKRFRLANQIETTLEANPGTVDQAKFQAFREAGINRLSLGIQSLQDDKLKTLGRIHDREHALRAITSCHAAGFKNFNIDLMYGLPHQTIEDALADLTAAIACSPTHLSWYQLTIEPNTLFHHQPPPLPPEDYLWEMQLAGQQQLQTAGFIQYEISAYAQQQQVCLHNQNYWEFGDYLGIGAGAHSKMTTSSGEVLRFSQIKHPRLYLEPHSLPIGDRVSEADLIFEFMLNALRLTRGVPVELFTARTGLSFARVAPVVRAAKQKGLLVIDEQRICPSEQGMRFLNDLVGMFLPVVNKCK